MRASRVIAAILLPVICLVGFFFLAPGLTEYSRFRHRGSDYYGELTRECDAIRAGHLVGTNRFVELSVTDPSLPKIIRDLQPQKIKIYREGIWILHGGPIEFGILWEQDESRTNAWQLSTACESDVRVIYVARR